MFIFFIRSLRPICLSTLRSCLRSSGLYQKKNMRYDSFSRMLCAQ